jgi:hypothetical protein
MRDSFFGVDIVDNLKNGLNLFFETLENLLVDLVG